MEATFPPQMDEAQFTEHITIAIWQKLGRYAKVMVDITANESDEAGHHELGQADYLRWIRAF